MKIAALFFVFSLSAIPVFADHCDDALDRLVTAVVSAQNSSIELSLMRETGPVYETALHIKEVEWKTVHAAKTQAVTACKMAELLELTK